MEYKEEDFLQLSGIQHFIFCRRRWALIHIEQQWAENFCTIDGEILHKNAHDADKTESRGDLYITHGTAIFSATLGVSGQCDVVEFRRSENGVPLAGKSGKWLPYPVEYKRGKPNPQAGDLYQLCGQAMCLEEMLCCDIPEGALYYGEIRRRVPVQFTPELRQSVKNALVEMHDLYRRGHTPKVKTNKSCNACSLKEICVPKLNRNLSVSAYLREGLEE